MLFRSKCCSQEDLDTVGCPYRDACAEQQGTGNQRPVVLIPPTKKCACFALEPFVNLAIDRLIMRCKYCSVGRTSESEMPRFRRIVGSYVRASWKAVPGARKRTLRDGYGSIRNRTRLPNIFASRTIIRDGEVDGAGLGTRRQSPFRRHQSGSAQGDRQPL